MDNPLAQDSDGLVLHITYWGGYSINDLKQQFPKVSVPKKVGANNCESSCKL